MKKSLAYSILWLVPLFAGLLLSSQAKADYCWTRTSLEVSEFGNEWNVSFPQCASTIPDLCTSGSGTLSYLGESHSVNFNYAFSRGHKCELEAAGGRAYRLSISGLKIVDCPEGEVPTYAGCEVPQPPPLECPDGQVADPVENVCVCEDGNEGCMDEEPEVCDSNETCLVDAQEQCTEAGSELMDFTYLGGGEYSSRCGLSTSDCPAGSSWYAPSQACISDTDGDGTGDAFDPEPEDPTEDGDTDDDGVPDSQDSHPEDPQQWNNHGGILGGQPVNIGSPQAPIGQTSEFNDTAIVNSLNELIAQTNTNNSLIDKVQETQAATNDILNEGFNGVSTGLGQVASAQGTTNDLLSQINDSLEPREGQAVNEEMSALAGQSASELGIREITSADSEFIDTGSTIFKEAECNNPQFPEVTLDVCSLASRVVPFAEWALWLLTLVFVWFELHSVLRRD